MDSIKNLLSSAINRHGIGRQVKAATVCVAWEKEVTSVLATEVAGETEIVSFKQGTLKVSVPGPSFSQAVKMQEIELLDRINKRLGQNTVERISLIISN